jgi:hypothetical protein
VIPAKALAEPFDLEQRFGLGHHASLLRRHD